MSTYRCVICRTKVEYEGRLPAEYPFCSQRCRMVDLGLWFREAYSFDREATPEDTHSGEPRSPDSPSGLE